MVPTCRSLQAASRASHLGIVSTAKESSLALQDLVVGALVSRCLVRRKAELILVLIVVIQASQVIL